MHRQFLVLTLLPLTFSLAACGTTQAAPQVAAQPTVAPTAATSPTIVPQPTVELTPTTIVAIPTASAAPMAVTVVNEALSVFRKKIDLGGYGLFIKCFGMGSPTVVLDAGGTRPSSDWATVIIGVMKFTRVCAYDRAGLGESDPAPKPRTSQDMVKDLHTLLVNANIAGPYVLVGHSVAGWNVQLYASQYPKEVAGIVLVDTSHPDQFTRVVAALPPKSSGESADLTQFRKDWEETYTSPYANSPDNPEGQDFVASAAQVRAAGSLGDILLVVLAAGNHEFPPSFSADLVANIEHVLLALQNEHAALSSNSLLIMAKSSGHCIHCDHPEIVSDAIQQVVESARNHTRLKAP
ncbi:MAG: alpha/beta hydrolase [Herpetosiphonaceae bacterium]|nr:alpha/beta hydrolase [Herpetosiphonaceae bacterium]